VEGSEDIVGDFVGPPLAASLAPSLSLVASRPLVASLPIDV